MSGKVDILMPSNSLYEVQHHFARKLYEAFTRTGMECRLLEGDDRYLLPAQSPPDFTIGFNGGLQIEQGVFLADVIRIPHVACLIDPPFRFLSLTSSPYTIITCDDRFCCDMVKTLNFPHVLFLPHAVEAELTFDPHQQRIYDVTMLGTFIDCEQRKQTWLNLFPDTILKAMDEAIDKTLNDNTSSFLLNVLQSLHPLLWTSDGTLAIKPEMYYQIFSEVEIYIKGRDRLSLIESLDECQIDIFGGSVDTSNWAEYFKGKPNIKVHPAVPYAQALEIMKQSKVVLNSSIKNRAGAHERIFTSAACGAICVTNENAYLTEHFSDGKDMLFYTHRELGQLQPKVQQLLTDENKRLQIAERGKNTVMAHHTWDHRVHHLLKEIKPILKKIQSTHHP